MQVGAGAAGLLGDGEVAVDRLVLELVHVLGLELGLAVVIEDAPVHVGCMVQVHAHAAGAAGELLLHAQDVELGEVPSAVLRRQREAVEVVLLGDLVELLREGVGHLDLRLHLLERALGQLADLLEIRIELLSGQSAHVILLQVT